MPVAPSPSPAQFATPEAAPPRKRVRFRALVAPLALAVLGATALSGVLLSGGGDGSPIAGPPAKPAGVSRPPSTTSRPAATATSASPTVEPSPAPTADTSASPQLLRRLPVAIAETCEAFPISKDSTYAEGLVRAVQCQPTGADAPADVWYLQYADADAMSAAFAEVTGSARYVDGDCTAPGQQFAYVTDEAPGRVAGRLRCYGGQDVSGLAWTHDRLRILSVTEAEGTDLASLVHVVVHRRAVPRAAPRTGAPSRSERRKKRTPAARLLGGSGRRWSRPTRSLSGSSIHYRARVTQATAPRWAIPSRGDRTPHPHSPTRSGWPGPTKPAHLRAAAPVWATQWPAATGRADARLDDPGGDDAGLASGHHPAAGGDLPGPGGVDGSGRRVVGFATTMPSRTRMPSPA